MDLMQVLEETAREFSNEKNVLFIDYMLRIGSKKTLLENYYLAVKNARYYEKEGFKLMQSIWENEELRLVKLIFLQD